MKAWNYITINFHQDVGQEYSKIVQIIVKADRGKAIAWRSVSYKMTCYHIQDEKTLQILSLHFVPTLQSAVYILYLVYISYLVCSLLSAFCTNRYPWHQYSLFLVTVICTTHNLIKTCVWVNSTFLFFSAIIDYDYYDGSPWHMYYFQTTCLRRTLCFCYL